MLSATVKATAAAQLGHSEENQSATFRRTKIEGGSDLCSNLEPNTEFDTDSNLHLSEAATSV